MDKENKATIRDLLRYALPLGTRMLAGDPETEVNWSVPIRAQPPAFPEIYGGELALVSMDVLRSFDNRLTLAVVLRQLANFGIQAVLTMGRVEPEAVQIAEEYKVCLLSVPTQSSLTTIERAVNTLVLNRGARLTKRAIEIQRQLTRMIAENRDLQSLLGVLARSMGKAIALHGEAGMQIAFALPYMGGRQGAAQPSPARRQRFQAWLIREMSKQRKDIARSPLGFTIALHVEKRVAGYLTLVDNASALSDFERQVLTYGADVCAIELAKTRAIASAVEQTRGDWIQMWLSGKPADEELLWRRAQQSGFAPDLPFVLVVFRADLVERQPLAQDTLLAFLRDELSRRGIKGAVGQYVDVILALIPLAADDSGSLARLQELAEELRVLVGERGATGDVAAGISRPATSLMALREAYREAKDAVSIAAELGESATSTYYGDLKLYQLLLALKEHNLAQLQQFTQEALEPIIAQDQRKQSELVHTLSGFFAANGNLAKAAQSLDVHRNTLVYRLERIEQLTQLDMDDAENRLVLHLALKMRRVLATLPSAAAAAE